MQEAVYQYNTTSHQATGFFPHLLHYGYEHASPGLLHPEGMPANLPLNTQADKMKFTRTMQKVHELIRGIVLKNQESTIKELKSTI